MEKGNAGRWAEAEFKLRFRRHPELEDPDSEDEQILAILEEWYAEPVGDSTVNDDSDMAIAFLYRNEDRPAIDLAVLLASEIGDSLQRK